MLSLLCSVAATHTLKCDMRYVGRHACLLISLSMISDEVQLATGVSHLK